MPRGLPDLHEVTSEFAGEQFDEQGFGEKARELGTSFKGTSLEPLFPPNGNFDGQVYEFLRFLREVFDWLVERKTDDGDAKPGRVGPGPGSFTLPQFEIEQIVIAPNGTLRFERWVDNVGQLHRLLRASLNGLEAWPIRRCEVPACRKFFFARRKDQFACSRTCANRRRVMKHYKKKTRSLAGACDAHKE